MTSAELLQVNRESQTVHGAQGWLLALRVMPPGFGYDGL